MTQHSRLLENKHINVDDSERQAVLSALEGRQLAGTAKIVTQYEEDLASYFYAQHALAVSSGTAALHLLLIMLDVKQGDEVVLSPAAPIMTALPILAVGGKPVFVDIEKRSFGLDVSDLKTKISPRTKAIISIPMWGYPTDLSEIRAIAAENKIPLIEDASHCHGAKTGETFVGANADISFFSTQERKLVCTGEGGFILTDNDEYADRVREIRDFGKPVRNTPGLAAHLGQYGYLFGLNFRLAALSAALGVAQLKKLEQKIAIRTRNAAVLRQALSDIDWLVEWPIMDGSAPNYYAMVLQVKNRNAKQVGKFLSEQGIISDTYRFDSKPLYELPLLSGYASQCKNTADILGSIITLPTHEGLKKADLERIAKYLHSI